jgi:competence protein ComEC
MTQISGVILCLAYILGLLSTAISWGSYAVLAMGIGAAVVIPRFWRVGPKAALWLIAGVVGLFATLYLQVQTPQPAVNDISKFVQDVDGTNQEQIFTVQGKIVSPPRLTRSQRGQFWLETTQLEIKGGDEAALAQTVTGKLYVTVPLLQATGLYPGQVIAVTGVLYKPKPAVNPGSFDFRSYLEREGTFAGFSGRQVIPTAQKPQWGWWIIRQRIVRSQVRWLGRPEGPIVSSMVLGSKAVDLPYDIRDSFIQVGLAHALAASGFQTSLILSLLLVITKRLSSRAQVAWGVSALVIFLGLTGLQPSVLRAVVMGFGALIALAIRRKVKPLGTLLLAATLLLLFNPLWIWDLGFQLSFLATLGLLVTVPPLIKKLDWIPPAIACLIAVPIAASIWTLPLQLHVFGVVPLYSLVVNVLTTPLISVISISGIISALTALIWPLAGSALSWLLYYPTHWLIVLVQVFSQLPGNSIAVGTISVLQLLAIYGLISLVWLQPWWRRRWWLAGALSFTLVLIPVWQTQATVLRVTVLATDAEPVMVIQEHGQVTLINSGDADTVRFTVLPFLQQQGINKINWAIAINSQSSISGWLEILKRLPVKNFYNHVALDSDPATNSKILKAVQAHWAKHHFLSVGQTVTAGSTTMQLINAQAPMLQLEIQGQTWLLLGLKPNQENKLLTQLPRVQVLCWSGEVVAPNLLQAIKPQVAIISSPTPDPNTVSTLRQGKTQVFLTGRDGAIQSTPGGKFAAAIIASENRNSLL